MSKSHKVVPPRVINIAVSKNIGQWGTGAADGSVSELLAKQCVASDNLVVRIFELDAGASNNLIRVVNGKFVSNYDIIIWHENFYGQRETDLVVPRYLKSLQHARFASAAIGDPSFNNIPTWSAPSRRAGTYCLRSVPKLPKGRYIVRPELGARSLGMLLVNTHEQDMVTVLNTDRKALFNGDISLHGVAVHKGHEFIDDEGVDEFNHGFFIQESVDHPLKEYRIVVGPGGYINTVFERARRELDTTLQVADSSSNDTFLFAVPTQGNIGTLLEKHNFDESVFANINKACGNAGIEYSSIDVYTYVDPKDSKIRWGMFEHCNQFSMYDWPEKVAMDLISKWYDNLVTDFFAEECIGASSAENNHA